MPYDPDRIPMRELERLTHVPRATILFYIKEGLLPEPKKTARNMAYYDHRFVEGLSVIRELRERHRLSLQQTKEVLHRENGSPDLALLLEVRDRVFHQIAANPDQPPVTWEQVKEQTGLGEEVLQRLAEMRLLFPLPGSDQGRAPLYHHDSLVMARLLKHALDLGIPLTALASAAESMAGLTTLEVQAFLQHVAGPMAAKGETAETIWAATRLSMDLAQSFIALVHLHNLYRHILTPAWPAQVAEKALSHLTSPQPQQNMHPGTL